MIGLTGGIASGKSTVTRYLAFKGAYIADADAISREVMDLPEVLRSVRLAFGPEVFSEDGSLDRRALARRAFADEEGAKLLDSITHPVIARELIARVREAEASREYSLVFVDAPLLIESGFYTLCDRIWLVTADAETRIARVMLRDGLTRAEAEMRIARQMPDEEKRRYASTVIENDGGLAELLSRVEEAYAEELMLSRDPDYDDIRTDYDEQ
ncbi:MAG: dephospho-CoA kinase [Clostridia bacterium]|nr:dephospho-CoA kinase [Clostridia bacterium]